MQRPQGSTHSCNDAVPALSFLRRIFQIEAVDGAAPVGREVAAAVVDAVAHDGCDREELGRHSLIVKGGARGLEVLAKIAGRCVARVVTQRVDGERRATVGSFELPAYAAGRGPVRRRENGARNIE